MSAPTFFPGYEAPPGHDEAKPLRRTSRRKLLLIWLVPVVVVGGLLIGLAAKMTTPSVRFVCPPDCGRPPTGTPVATNPRFTAPDGSFSVSYPSPGAAYTITTHNDGVTAEFIGGEGGTLRLFSRPADGKSPEQIANELVAAALPDARTAYEIPNAMVGYQPGWGKAADCWPQGSTTSYQKMRVLIMVAVKNDLALVAAASGPFHEFGPDFGAGKPSGASLQLALDMGKYVNSFSWRGDPPR